MRSLPSEAAVIPLPRPETTPPVTNIYLVGTVVYAGVLELTGYTVIIDHGFGLKTWYWHMSENSVQTGAVVKRGDVVGKTGKTGFTSQNGVHLGMSVCDVFVSPYATWSDGDWKDVPLYTK